jgi:hypothetical protein
VPLIAILSLGLLMFATIVASALFAGPEKMFETNRQHSAHEPSVSRPEC